MTLTRVRAYPPDKGPMEQRRAEPRETALGYELDTITLRDIAAVRYVRHHEWLHHVLGSAVPASHIRQSSAAPETSAADLEAELAKAEAELAQLRSERDAGWSLDANKSDAKVLIDSMARLREEFGSTVADDVVETVETSLGRKIVPQQQVNPVPVTYNREAEEALALADDAMVDA